MRPIPCNNGGPLRAFLLLEELSRKGAKTQSNLCDDEVSSLRLRDFA